MSSNFIIAVAIGVVIVVVIGVVIVVVVVVVIFVIIVVVVVVVGIEFVAALIDFAEQEMARTKIGGKLESI